MIWQYDGTFEGFLTACFRVFEAKDTAAHLRVSGDLMELDIEGLQDLVVVENQLDLARRVWEGLERMAGPEGAALLRDAFLHQKPGGSNAFLEYLRQCVRYGAKAQERLAEFAVRETELRALAVRREAHRFQGFLRFREISDSITLYADFRPDNDVLPLLVPHFTDRLGARNWMIHDLGRAKAVVHYQGRLEFLYSVRLEQTPQVSEQELGFQDLWKGFFRNIAIPQRRNPTLQRALLPKKYRAFLVEEPGTSATTSSISTGGIGTDALPVGTDPVSRTRAALGI